MSSTTIVVSDSGVAPLPIRAAEDVKPVERIPAQMPAISTAAEETGMSRKTIFVVQVLWLALLGGAAAAFLRSYPGGVMILGIMPIGVVWFGAVGAALVSLTSVVDHAHDWDPSLDLWHLSRPIVGAILAIVTVLMLMAGVLAIGASTPASTGGAPLPAGGAPLPKDILYYVVAFLVGYREDAFRDLIKQVVDLIVRPAAKAEPADEQARRGGQNQGKPTQVKPIQGERPTA